MEDSDPAPTSAKDADKPAKIPFFRRVGRALKNAAPSLAIVAVTLALIDVAMMVTGAFPPRYRPGHATLGFYENRFIEEGVFGVSQAPELQADEKAKHYWKNEEGFASDRRMSEFRDHPIGKRIVALGDSHTELPYNFSLTHMGVLERRLREGGWKDAEVLGAGHGRWSPLQESYLYQEVLAPIHPEVVVMNFYLGNDFYDLIRTDDRPHLVSQPDGSYTIGAPQWVAYFDPTTDPFWRKSRVFYAGHLLLDKIGIENNWEKLIYAQSSAAAFGVSIFSSFGYINDLRKTKDDALWYDAAIGAQVLNQALFFKHFPGSEEESQKRARYVLKHMADALKAKGDTALLVLSPIPSRMLAQPDYDDPAYTRILSRMPFTRDEVFEMEARCYEVLRSAAADAGWLFVDTLPALREGPKDEYFASDLHIAPPGSEILGTEQSKVILKAMPTKEEAAPEPPPEAPAPEAP